MTKVVVDSDFALAEWKLLIKSYQSNKFGGGGMGA